MWTQKYLIDWQVDKLESITQNATGASLKLSSNMIGLCNDETSFPQKTFLTDRQVRIKLSKHKFLKKYNQVDSLGNFLDHLWNLIYH